ncbi:MAG: ATPase [bacterium]|nr:MAG: ATPase [bacterium]
MIIRENYNKKIKEAFKALPVVVLIGARQVGKTTIMTGYPYDKKTHFINGQNPEIIEIFSKHSNVENYLKMQLNPQLEGYLLIDEFQFIPRISTTIKLLTDSNKRLKIITTGSSSLDIIQHVEESLAGRVRMIDVYSLSFPEYIKFCDKKLFGIYNKYDCFTEDTIIDGKIKLLELNYLTYGGLPRVALAQNNNEKINLLNDIYQTYLLQDVRAYIRNEDAVGFNKMLRLLSAQIGNLLNVNVLSRASGLNYKKTLEYLYLLEQMFIIKQVEPYSTNRKNTITKMKKIYFYDLGMRNMIYNSFNDIIIRTDNGALFENYVFLELIKNTPSYSTLNYYRTTDGAEVDFILDDMVVKKTFEAKFKHLDKPLGIRSLSGFNKAGNIKESYLINQSLNIIQNGIHYLPSCLVSKVF